MVHRPSQRPALAAVVGLALILGGLLGLAHRAQTGHVHDPATGAWRHTAPGVRDHVAAAAAHLHPQGLPEDTQGDACPLCTQTTMTAGSAARRPVAIARVATAAPAAVGVDAPITTPVLAVAPKTSPPQA